MLNPPSINASKQSQYFWAFIIIAVTFIFYLPALDGALLWDDENYVYPEKILSLAGLWKIWFTTETQQYYPLLHSTYWFEQRFWGLTTLPYHAENIILQGVNGVLVWFLCRRLALKGAWVIGMIFALHPVHVESVAWITERKNLMSGFFFILSIMAYLNFEDDKEGKGKRWYIYSFICFACAMLSKTVATTLPVALIVIRWFRTNEFKAGYIVKLAPFFAVSLVMGLLTIWWERNVVGASGLEWDLSLVDRALIAGRSAWFYVGKFLLPLKLVFVYKKVEPDTASILQWAYLLTSVGLGLILLLLRKKIGRGALSAYLYYLVTLSLMLGFFDVFFYRYSYVSDHFPYPASIGVIAGVVGVAAWALGKLNESGRKIAVVISVIVIIIFGGIVWKQTKVYANDETLWRYTISINPEAWIAHNNLGKILYERGDKLEALSHAEKAVKISPFARKARYNLASTLVEFGRYREAELHYREAIKVRDNFAEAHAGLATVLLETGRYDEAHASATRALMLDPDNELVRNSLGGVLVRMNRIGDALVHYKEALRVNPASAETHSNIGVALSAENKYKEAKEYFQKAFTLDPNYADAYYNLGVTLTDEGLLNEAEEQYKRTVAIDPEHAKAYNNLGNISFHRNELKEAVSYYEKALSIRPDFPEARNNLDFVKGKLK